MNLKELIKQHKADKKKYASIYQQMREYYGRNYETMPIEDKTILYETRDGTSITDSPYAIFLNLVNNDQYAEYKHIWVLKEDKNDALINIPEEFLERVTICKRGTLEYVDAMLAAKYVITNSTFETFFTKRPGQVYINTWHGTPLKVMGFDIPEAINQPQNILRNFLMTDFIVSPNSHTTQIFADAYRLRHAYSGKIIEHGYPRIDLTLHTDKESMLNKLSKVGVTLDPSKPTLLYTPTWRGTSIQHANNTLEQTVTEVLTLQERFKESHNIIVKVHPFAYKYMVNEERLNGLLVADFIDPNELLSVVDTLITDYSSIFFDFLVTNKPILFYVWDKDLYSKERGMYIEQAKLPGPTAETMDELIALIEDGDEAMTPYKERYEKMKERMVPYDNGQVTQDYIETIFEEKSKKDVKVISIDSNKTKLLLYPGGMRKNGITSSFLNLVDNIDYDKYDVTVLADLPRMSEVKYNFSKLNKHVRCLYRTGAPIFSKEEFKADRQLIHRDFDSNKPVIYPDVAYRRETNRLLGNLAFDSAIDFSGYSLFWAKNILGAKARQYIVFQHNDLYADAHREVDGHMPMYRGLRNLFSYYNKFDKLISVSPMTMEVNREKLSEFIREEQLGYSINTINIDNILGLNQKSQTVVEAEPKIIIKQNEKVFSENTKVIIYKNLDDLRNKKGRDVLVTTSDKVMSHASVCVEKIDYDKVTINGVYFGWTSSEKLNLMPLMIESIEDYHAVGTVFRPQNFPIWKELRKNDGTDVMLTRAKYFKGNYLTISKLATTLSGNYYFVSYLGEELGWVSTKPLARIHKLNQLSPVWLYFNQRSKKKHETLKIAYSDKVEVIDEYVRISNQVELENLEIFSEPKGLTGSEQVKIDPEIKTQLLQAYEKVTVGESTYVSLKNHGKFVGYIEESQLTYQDKEEAEKIIERMMKENQHMVQLPEYDLAGNKVAPIDDHFYNMVTMGRLSPEKNQVALINGFAIFNQKYPKTRLYLLGKGPLQNELIEAINENDLAGKVFLLGHIDNPFKFVEAANVFVLPSHYEGQPMVLLESMTLGLPILASDIPANRNVVGEEEYGLYIEGFEPTDISKGMEKIYNNKKSFKKFDYELYNKAAIDNFYKHIVRK